MLWCFTINFRMRRLGIAFFISQLEDIAVSSSREIQAPRKWRERPSPSFPMGVVVISARPRDKIHYVAAG